jgi:hypothetical protein
MTEGRGLENLAFDGRKLEDSFFLRKDKELIEKQKALMRIKKTKEELAGVSGINAVSPEEKAVLAEMEKAFQG